MGNPAPRQAGWKGRAPQWRRPAPSGCRRNCAAPSPRCAKRQSPGRAGSSPCADRPVRSQAGDDAAGRPCGQPGRHGPAAAAGEARRAGRHPRQRHHAPRSRHGCRGPPGRGRSAGWDGRGKAPRPEPRAAGRGRAVSAGSGRCSGSTWPRPPPGPQRRAPPPVPGGKQLEFHHGREMLERVALRRQKGRTALDVEEAAGLSPARTAASRARKRLQTPRPAGGAVVRHEPVDQGALAPRTGVLLLTLGMLSVFAALLHMQC